MNDFEIKINNNTKDMNNALMTLNKIYKQRIELLEEEISSRNKDVFFEKLRSFDDDLDTEDTNLSEDLLEEIKPVLDKKDNSKSTSIRISTETKELLDKARLDFMNYYKKNLSYSQTILLLMEIYEKHNE